MWLVARRKKREELSNEETDLHLFVDEGMHPEGEGEEDQLNASFVNDNIDDYDDTDDYDSSNLASGKASHASSRKSMRSNGGSFYGDNNNNDYGLDSSYNTGVSTGDDYDSWLASQNVSQNVEYEGEDGSNSSDGDEYDSERLKPPSLNSMT